MRLFVAQLSFDTKTEDLRKAFEVYGTVNDAEVILNKKSDRSRGFGFVQMDNDEEATAAMTALNETDLQGRTIVVKVATAK